MRKFFQFKQEKLRTVTTMDEISTAQKIALLRSLLSNAKDTEKPIFEEMIRDYHRKAGNIVERTN